jgi:hypothetical protein
MNGWLCWKSKISMGVAELRDCLQRAAQCAMLTKFSVSTSRMGNNDEHEVAAGADHSHGRVETARWTLN